jgi:hypothetical protein
MNVAVFQTVNNWVVHLETELEIIQRHLDDGDSITYITCDATMLNCVQNPYKDLSACFRCQAKRDKGLKLLSKTVRRQNYLNLNDEERKILQEVPGEFESLEEIKAYTVDGFDVGMAAVSSLISNIRNPRPDVKTHKNVLNRFIISALSVYFSMIRYIEENRPDTIINFNGRFAHTRAVLRACEKTKTRCQIHERSRNLSKYVLIDNATPHNIKIAQQNAELLWNNSDDETRMKYAEQFFQSRLNNQDNNWFSFTKSHVEMLPDNWDAHKKNIVIFNSSEDEFAAIGKEYDNPIYLNQIDGIRQLIHSFENLSGYHLYLRIHPNLKRANNPDKAELYTLQGKNFTLIKAEDEISTYLLLKSCDISITFGSTIGIESAFLNKPSILLGAARHKGMGCNYEPRNHQECIDLILKDKLDPLPSIGAFKLAFYYEYFGKDYIYYKPIDYKNGTFKNKVISEPKPIKTILFQALQAVNPNLKNKVEDKIKLIQKNKLLYGA